MRLRAIRDHRDSRSTPGETTAESPVDGRERRVRIGLLLNLVERSRARFEFVVPLLDPVQTGLEESYRLDLDFVIHSVLLGRVEMAEAEDLQNAPLGSFWHMTRRRRKE
jgi:hypothetical protein